MTVQNIPRQQAVGINRRRLGDIVVTLIDDGFQDFSFDLLSNITADAAKDLLVAAHLPPIPRMSINSYVIQDGKRTTLIDGGAGGFHGGGRLKHAANRRRRNLNQGAANTDGRLPEGVFAREREREREKKNRTTDRANL